MANIKSMLRSGVKPEDSAKPFVYGKLSQTDESITITFPRKVMLDSLRESDTSLFACIQAKPEAISMLVTDEESGKVFQVPVDRLVNLNFFANWQKHQIVGRRPVTVPMREADHTVSDGLLPSEA